MNTHRRNQIHSRLGLAFMTIALVMAACGEGPESRPAAGSPPAPPVAAPTDTSASPEGAPVTQPQQGTDSSALTGATTSDPASSATKPIAVAAGDAVHMTVAAPSGDWEAVSFTDGSFSLDGLMANGDRVRVAYDSSTGQGVMVIESEGADAVVVRRVGNPPTSWLDSVHAVREDVLLTGSASLVATVGDTAALDGTGSPGRLRGALHRDMALLQSFTAEAEPGNVVQSWEATAPVDYVGPSITQIISALDDPTADVVDYLFRPATLAELDGKLSYEIPYLPDSLPGGFELSTVFYADKSSVPPSGANPESEEVIVVTYRRAYDHITVTFRTARPSTWDQPNEEVPDPVWSDPYADLAGPAKYEIPLGIDSVFSDARVGFGIPLHVWHVDDNRVTIIETSGDISALAAAAASLTEALLNGS